MGHLARGLLAATLVLPGEAAASPWALRAQQPEPTTPAPDPATAPPPAPASPEPTTTAPAAHSPWVPAPVVTPASPPPGVRFEREPPTGRDMLFLGGFFVVISGSFLGGGATLVVRNPPENDDEPAREGTSNRGLRRGGYVMLGLGAGLVLAGLAMLVVGGVQRVRWKRWNERRLAPTPTVATTRHGTWTAGLELRF